MLKLKPCPFCGEVAHVRRDGQGYRIECTSCRATGPKAAIRPWHRTKFIAQANAAKAWNIRVKKEDRRGKWVETEEQIFQCSECGYEDFFCMDPEEGLKFCSRCGAKMDLEDDLRRSYAK